MDTAMTLNWLEMRRTTTARARQDDQARLLTLTRENARLAEENKRLRDAYTDLAASTEIWIRLYEAALDRSHGRAQARAHALPQATVQSAHRLN